MTEPVRCRATDTAAAPAGRTPREAARARPTVPALLLAGRYHGSLDAISDSGRRALRPIGASAYEVAVRTGTLLADLLALPGVRIFQGIRPVSADEPPIPHAVNAGRRIVLIDSVAWPPGRYSAAVTGRIYCDGIYIGQSARPLMAAVGYWRQILPRTRVSALVVVHSTGTGRELALPAATPDLAWARAADAARDIRTRLLRGRGRVSRNAVAALAAATRGGRCGG
jgi:hypothetical protein